MTARVEFTMRRRRATKRPSAPITESAPRLTRLLALAHRWNRLVDEGIVVNYAEIARLMGLSRARVTQIVDLSFLAPDIQDEILLGDADATEREIREIARAPEWDEQRRLWRSLRAVKMTHVSRGPVF